MEMLSLREMIARHVAPGQTLALKAPEPGPLAEVLGVRFWYVVGGLVCIVMGSLALVIPSVVNAERLAAERAAGLAEQT